MTWVLRLWVAALLALAAAPGVAWADRNQATKIADDLASIAAQHAAAAARGLPSGHVDPRAPQERVRAWLRRAQELEALRVVG